MLILQSSFYRLNFKIRGVHPYRAPTQCLPFLLEYDTQSGGGVKNWNCVTTSGIRIASLLVFLARRNNVVAEVYRQTKFAGEFKDGIAGKILN